MPIHVYEGTVVGCVVGSRDTCWLQGTFLLLNTSNFGVPQILHTLMYSVHILKIIRFPSYVFHYFHPTDKSAAAAGNERYTIEG